MVDRVSIGWNSWEVSRGSRGGDATVHQYGKLANEAEEVLFVSITEGRCNCFVPRNTDEGWSVWFARMYTRYDVWPTF